jgi:hypothetical protein
MGVAAILMTATMVTPSGGWALVFLSFAYAGILAQQPNLSAICLDATRKQPWRRVRVHEQRWRRGFFCLLDRLRLHRRLHRLVRRTVHSDGGVVMRGRLGVAEG